MISSGRLPVFKMRFRQNRMGWILLLLLLWPANGQAIFHSISRGKAIHFVQTLLQRGDQQTLQQEIRSLAERPDLPPQEAAEIGRLLTAYGHTQWAIDFLKAQQKRHPRSVAIARALAEGYIAANRLSEAISEYRQLVRMAPDSLAFYLRLGEIALWQEDQATAMAAYESALRLEPQNREALSRLRQLYLWNEKLEKAYQLEKILLRLDPENAALWKEHARHARWLEKQEDAIRASKRYLKLRPEDMEVWLWLGEGYLWTNRPRQAEPIFRFILSHDPDNVRARLYLAQILQWQPGRWQQARSHYLAILRQRPQHEQARKGLMQLRELYGPQTRAQGSYYIDSNRLEKTRVTVGYERYYRSEWQIEWRTYFFAMAEDKMMGTVRVNGIGGEAQWRRVLTPRARFSATLGGLRFRSSETFAILRLQGDVAWRDGLYSAFYYQFNPVEDGVLAIKNRYRAHRIGQNFGGRFGNRLRLFVDSQLAWYSDGNRKGIFYSEADFRLFGRTPSVHLAGIFSYEHTTLQYPNSTPYWTPYRFWSRSIGLIAESPLGSASRLKAGVYLTQQPGNETARNGFIELDWRVSRFSRARLAYRDFGSQFYAYRYVEAGLWIRW